MGILVPLADRAWVIPGGVNIGVLLNENGQIVLVDTGLNDSSAKKALKVVRAELGGEVVAVLTTHAHADHFGGNATVVKRTGAVVHAPAFDEAYLRYPLLQPALLFGGADPLDTLRGNFLLADPSPVDTIVEAGPNEVAGISVEAVPLHGHSPGQLGYVVGDVFFCADVVLPESVLDKYRIPYLFSLTDHLAALERARTVPHRVAVAGHGPLLEGGQLHDLIDLNAALAHRVADGILDVVAEPASTEAILEEILRRFGAPVTDAPSFYLLQPTVFAFLSHLHRQGVISHHVRDGRSLWTRA
ncbi:MAG TPA: MBL fold metallo-hydrolase [Thermomicrobiales bacterium]|nr:MBL fold metallo-hydrolase [Thermomicrobiales bacterium]